jgi:hypothetical protein
MNCSQLLEKRVTTNWERPAKALQDMHEDLAPQANDMHRWGALRYASTGQTYVTRFTPSFKPFSS